MLLVGGCPPLVNPDPPDESWHSEPNNTFDEANEVELDADGTARIVGPVTTVNDVDVYRFGEFLAGDRIIVDVSGQGGLDADAALFDEGGRLIFENDDRNLELNQLDPFINHVIREDTSVLYLGIASSPLNPTSGTYDAVITVTRGGEVPAPQPQTVILNVTGGSVTISNRTYDIEPFDTADIHTVYTGLTQIVIDHIVATVLENYSGLQLSVLVTGRDTIPPDCAGSTVLLGGSNASAYGLAEQIDWYNEDTCDNAVVFTELFQPFRFGRTLTARELGTAIGNVVSHEVGHLLGLNHVANVEDIMDTTGSASTFLLDQQFMTSPLHSTIFPLGLQDGLMLLAWTLGIAE